MKNCVERIKCGEIMVIGVRDYTNCNEPLSGLFINSIPGIDLKVASAIASAEYENGSKLLKEKIIDATKFVLNDFKRAIGPSFQFNAILEAANHCEFSKGSAFFWPVDSSNRGLKVSRYEQPLAKIKLKRLFIRVNTAGPATIKIEDKNEVYSYDTTLVQGLNVLEINEKFNDDEIFITMDNSAIEVSQGFCFNSCNDCGGDVKNLIVQGWNGTTVDTYLYGMNAEVVLECDEEELFCLALDKLYYSILNKSAEFVFDVMATTNRLNNIANVNKELAKEKVEEYEDKYKKEFKESTKSLSSLLKSFKGDCITCKGNKYVSMLP